MSKSSSDENSGLHGDKEQQQRLSMAWIVASLAGLNLLIYSQVIGFEVISGWDDHLYFISHSLLENWSTAGWQERLLTPEIGYPGPIPTFMYFVVHQLPEALVVPAAHGLNLVFHLINVGLVYAVLRRFLESRKQAWIVALLWSAHPLLAETVAWISNLKSVGMATAVLAAVLVWHRYLEKPGVAPLIGAGLFVLMGLAFKPPAIAILPLLLGLTLVIRPALLWRPATIVLATITGGISAIYLWAARAMHHGFVQEDGFAATAGGFWETVERIGAAFWVQAQNMVYPVDLHPMYFPGEISGGQAVVGWIGLIILATWTVWAYFKCRSGVPGMILFWMMYLPHSGIEFLPRFTADTYMYLPLLGLLWSGAGAWSLIDDEVIERRRRVLKIGVVAVVAAFSLVAFAQTARWATEYTLWKPQLERFPQQHIAHHMVGQVYANHGEPGRAIEYFEDSLDHGIDVAGDRVMALAYARERAGQPKKALDHMIDILSGELWEGRHIKPANASSYTVFLLVTHDLEIPEAGQGREEVIGAIEDVLSAGELEPSHVDRLVEYLRGQGEEEMAHRIQRFSDRR